MSWLRARFHANPDDFRPIEFPPPGPYWCTGYGDTYSVIVAYVKNREDIPKYWPEAHNVEAEEREEITFTSRFPKPDWWKA